MVCFPTDVVMFPHSFRDYSLPLFWIISHNAAKTFLQKSERGFLLQSLWKDKITGHVGSALFSVFLFSMHSSPCFSLSFSDKPRRHSACCCCSGECCLWMSAAHTAIHASALCLNVPLDSLGHSTKIHPMAVSHSIFHGIILDFYFLFA